MPFVNWLIVRLLNRVKVMLCINSEQAVFDFERILTSPELAIHFDE